jgi:hypothetical protein
MTRFILKTLLFFIVFFVAEKALIFFRNSMPARELDKRLEYITKGELNSDIVIIGSSRGARDILASQIADSFKVPVYNLSYPGSDIRFHEYLLKELVKNSRLKPKVVILVVDDPSEFKVDRTITFRFDRLYPLVKYENIRNTLVERGEKNYILSQLFIIHQLSVGSFDIRKKRFNSQDTILSDGSMPISWQSPKFDTSFQLQGLSYDPKGEVGEKIECYRRIMKLADQNNILLLATSPPNFYHPTPGFMKRVNELSGKAVLTMHYDTMNPIYRNPDYYFDKAHLKLNGAAVYTSEIVAYIKRNPMLYNTIVKR